jgi:hypothetical protein
LVATTLMPSPMTHLLDVLARAGDAPVYRDDALVQEPMTDMGSTVSPLT